MHRTNYSLLSLLALIAIVGLPRPASADNAAEARALFDAAKASAKAGDCATAVPKFAKSYQLDPKPGTLRNLGYCEEQLGRIASAWRHFREVIEKFPASNHVEYARERTAALEARVPKLTIRLAGGARDGITITLDGESVPQADVGKALAVDPGEHEIAVSASGRALARYDITIAEGEKRDEVVRSATLLTEHDEKGKASEANPDAGDQSANTMDPLGEGRTVALIVGGGGLTAGVVAAIAYLTARNAKESADKAAREGRASDMAHDRAEQNSWHSASIVLGAVSAAAVGSAVVLWIIAKPAPQAASANSRLRAVPVVGNRVAIVALEGRW